MASYRVLIKPSAAQELESLPLKDRKRIASRLQALGVHPRPLGCEKLVGVDRFRIRQGDYRIPYEVSDVNSQVHIVKIGH